MEDSLVVSCKTKHTLTKRSSNHAPLYLTQWDEGWVLYKKFVHECLRHVFHSYQMWKQLTCLPIRGMQKQTVGHQYDKMLFKIKGNQLLSNEKALRNVKNS